MLTEEQNPFNTDLRKITKGPKKTKKKKNNPIIFKQQIDEAKLSWTRVEMKELFLKG